MSFRFVHAADLHLDTPFQGYGQSSPILQAALRDASLRAFDSLIDLCIEEDAAFLLLAGDIYDGVNRGLRPQQRFLRGIERLAKENIKVFVIYGNHDPLGEGWGAVRSWPSNIHFFGSEGVEPVEVQLEGGPTVIIYGVSYPTKAVTENLALRYTRTSNKGVHIALLHATVGSTSEHDAYSPCTLAELAMIGMDYWALGHIHKRAVLAREMPWVVYPGSIQGRSPKPSEMEPKGAYVVEVEGDVIAEPRFVALDHI